MGRQKSLVEERDARHKNYRGCSFWNWRSRGWQWEALAKVIGREEIKEPRGQGVGRGINVPNKIITNYDGAVSRAWEWEWLPEESGGGYSKWGPLLGKRENGLQMAGQRPPTSRPCGVRASCSGVLEPALRAHVRPSSWSVTSGGSLKSVAAGMLTLAKSAKLYIRVPLPPNPGGADLPTHTWGQERRGAGTSGGPGFG